MKKKPKEDGVTMPPGKCLIASNDDRTFKKQIDRLCENDRKEVADFRRLLRKIHDHRKP